MFNFLAKRKVTLLKNRFLFSLNNKIFIYFLKNKLKYPVYVTNKRKVIRYCEINSIPVKSILILQYSL